jgi:hypothetical protein
MMQHSGTIMKIKLQNKLFVITKMVVSGIVWCLKRQNNYTLINITTQKNIQFIL